jgi:Heavy-metal resistance
MNRSLVIVLRTLILGAAVFAGAYFATRQVCATHIMRPADDLDWLKEEFHLSDAETARVRQLHEGYLPKCQEMCKRIAEKKNELEQTMSNTTNITGAAKQKLTELGELRAQCQAQMLQHFVEVSRAMPPEEGRRYLAEMQRLTLGFHEQTEQSMSGSASHASGRN